MERRTQDLPTLVLLVFAPTRVLFESNFARKRFAIGSWSFFFLLANCIFLFMLSTLKSHIHFLPGIYVLLWMLPFSRIVEIGYAFYNDSCDQLESKQPRSGLSRVQRLKLLGRSYVEVSICYASLYLALPNDSFVKAPTTGFGSLYFSWITITTTGFGEITPTSPLSRGLCMSEIGVGLMLIVFAVGTYFSYRAVDQ